MFLQVISFLVMLLLSGWMTFIVIALIFAMQSFGGQISDKVFTFVLAIGACTMWLVTFLYMPFSISIK